MSDDAAEMYRSLIHAPPGLDRVAALEVLLAAAEERGRLQGQFSPLGDNHHNAAACPYCGDLLTKAEERGRRRGRQEAIQEAANVCDGWLDAFADPIAARPWRIVAAQIRSLAPRDSAPVKPDPEIIGSEADADGLADYPYETDRK